MTRLQIRTEARTLLRDTNGMVFSDAFLNSAISMGVLSTELLTGCYEPTTTAITLSLNRMEYDNPLNTSGVDNQLKVYSVYYLADNTNIDDAKGLARIHPIIVGQELGVTTGEPSFYYDFGGKIGVYPAPSAAVISATGKLLVKGCKMGEYIPTASDADMVTNCLTYLPTEFHRSIVYYAVMSAYIKDGKHSQAGMYYSKWVNEAWAWRQMIVERPIDTLDKTRFPDRVVVNQPNQPASE